MLPSVSDTADSDERVYCAIYWFWFKRRRKTEVEPKGGECGRQVGGGWGRFDVRNMSLKPVSFVMCFKRFHAWAEFLLLMLFLLPVPNPDVKFPLVLWSYRTRRQRGVSAPAKLYLSHQSCEEVNLPLNCKLSHFTSLSCLIRSFHLGVSSFSRHLPQKPDAWFLKHLWQQGTTTYCGTCLWRSLPPPVPVT